MNFQDNLRTYRERLGLNAKDFAASIGIKYSTYASYENLGREPKYATLIKIAAALNVSIDELLGYKPNNNVDYWINYLRNIGISIDYDKDNNEIALYVGEQNSDGMAPYLPIPEKNFLRVMKIIEETADNEFAHKKSNSILKWFIAYAISSIVRNDNFDDKQAIKSLKYFLSYLNIKYDAWLKQIVDSIKL